VSDSNGRTQSREGAALGAPASDPHRGDVAPGAGTERLEVRHFEAMLFDLDGVITNSARGHGLAWKAVFDDFLGRLAARTGVAVAPFDPIVDYHDLVDGRPRYDGARSFLADRGVDLPFGEPTDTDDTETCCGLGNRKNTLYLQQLETTGVDLYESTAVLMRDLRSRGQRIAVVSASKNTETTLLRADLRDLVDVIVSGREASAWSLAGKPAPDTYLKALELIDVDASRAVAFEDSPPGVRAAAAARIGLVVGIDRDHDEEALRQSGADIVVRDASELVVVWEPEAEAPASTG